MSTSSDVNDEYISTDLKSSAEVTSNKRSLSDSPSNDIATPIKLNGNEKRLKFTNSPSFSKNDAKSDILIQDAIIKWQKCAITKCIYENAINTVLESVPANRDGDRISALTAFTRHSNLEDEAVLMAIEFKGLRQQSSDYNCSDFNKLKTPKSQEQMNNHNFHSDNENPELNFENSFLTTAVTAAIEEKGLSMYPL